jgi:hypothetical protein
MSKPKVLEQMRRQPANAPLAGSDGAIVRREPHDGVADLGADPGLMDCRSAPGLASVLREAMAAARTGDPA